ncbi:hypothetical protein DOTSEDRAFT_69948 [Dothistroma septosporum NZE10]|uniref:Cytoskeletal adapter protein sagA n=1 Tax=Dothistroma septosporum (strain NZE10 / CBS 128990) TaxID=675120 RepID=N1Q0N0_DOTSN|nr:hypothetical protein DOTSEDRAFT_69948 [Dothistroma septosporum NZE10]
MTDQEHAILNLSPDEKRAFGYLFAQADKDQLGVVTGENAVSFFERTKLSPNVLGEIWQIADTENRGLLTKPGFCMVLRLIGHYQAGREPSTELAFKPGPIPKFDGLQIPAIATGGVSGGSAVPSPTTGAFPTNPLQPQSSGQGPIRVPPLDPQKVQQYSGLFERSGAQNGRLDGATAKAIFERAGLPNEVLGRIWNLSDREQKGSLDQTEFIIAMHLLTSMKNRAMIALPTILPPGLYEAAARRGAPSSRQATVPLATAIPRQLTGSSATPVPRAQSPLTRPPGGFGTPPPSSAQTTVTPWLITPADKAKFDQFFNSIDTQRRGVLTGDQAVQFFSDSRLPEESLAQIWDLSDINSEGQLDKDEFAVAMYLIRQQRAPNAPPLPAFLPPALIPPSLRKQTQQTQSTAPAFDNTANAPTMPKSAADDLFGLDEISSSQSQSQAPVLQPQGTGASAARDPFSGGSPAAPSSPAQFQQPQSTGFQPQQQGPGGIFKPFLPTSAFGASLASQNTGGSVGSNQARGLPQQQAQQTSDDLLGDNETHAAESSKLTNETTELANMSNQIGNLRAQMEQTQAKKTATQADLTATNDQKRDLELRLQQFRSQFEQEVRTVKELEQQLAASKDSTKRLGQELAMLEGNYQDIQTQHQTLSQALQADQQENANLKQRIAEINAEVAKLKPEVEKLKLDARQQKGLASINKKQLATNESERDRLQAEKADLEREAAEREEAARSAPVVEHVASPVASPPAVVSNLASPALSSTNPFFRKPSNDGQERAISPQHTGSASGPTPSAFNALFGPSAAFGGSEHAGSRSGTPPPTSFASRAAPAAAAGLATAAIGAGAIGMSDSIQSFSSKGEHTPSATPPLSEQAKESPQVAEPPPPPPSQQFTASHLPVVAVDGKAPDSDASSVRVVPPASRAGEIDTPRDAPSVTDEAFERDAPRSVAEDPTLETAAQEHMPGAFPSDEAAPAPAHAGPTAANDDFDSMFAGFSDTDKAKESAREHDDPFAVPSSQAMPKASGSEFPPIESLEPDDESDSENEGRGFDDNFGSPPHGHAESSARDIAAPSTGPVFATAAGVGASSTSGLPTADAHQSPPAYDESDNATHGGSGERTEENQFDPKFGGLLPAREVPTSPPPPSEGPSAVATTTEVAPVTVGLQNAFHTPTASTNVAGAPAKSKNAFDDFDAFDDLSEAKEADKVGTGFDFGLNGEQSTEFNPAFDSPAASMTTTMASSQQTPVAASRTLYHPQSSGLPSFAPAASTISAFTGGHEESSIQHTPQDAKQDWDAIFSGLDNSKEIDTSLSNDPWGAPATNGSSSIAQAAQGFPRPPSIPVPKSSVPDRGGAITPGTEHDDPILKRLTGMGYPRMEALQALEKYDYDINKAVDHLSGN